MCGLVVLGKERKRLVSFDEAFASSGQDAAARRAADEATMGVTVERGAESSSEGAGKMETNASGSAILSEIQKKDAQKVFYVAQPQDNGKWLSE